MKKLLLLSLLVVSSYGQTILSENFGVPTATTLIPAYSTGTAPATFQNHSPIAFSGTADIRSSAPSSTYTGYSAGGNAYLSATMGKYIQIDGINTAAYQSANINFTFGLWAFNIPSTQMILQYSTDATNWINISYMNNTVAGWNLVTIPTGTLPSSATLSLKFSQPGTTDQFRIDDINIFNFNPSCTFALGSPTTTCNTTSYNIDTYSATIPYTGGGNGTYTITSTTGNVAGDNPTSVVNGNIIINGITEGTSVTIHTVGATCDWTLPIPARDCKPVNTLPFYEPFPYASGYAIGSSQKWEYISSGDDITATSPGLTYSGLSTSGNSATFVGSGNDVMVPFTDQTSGVIYVSFLMNVSTSTITTFPALTYFASFTKSTPSYQARLFLNSTSATQYQIGLDANASTTTNFDTTLRNVGDVVLVIMGYDFSTNTLKAWINPSNLSTFSTTTPTLTSVATTAIADIGGFVFRQDTALTTPTMIVDEVRIFNNPSYLLGSTQFNEISGFKIYPNPVRDGKLFIETLNVESSKSIVIYDMLGKQVLTTSTITNSIDVNGLTTGTYFVKVIEDDKTSVAKLMIK